MTKSQYIPFNPDWLAIEPTTARVSRLHVGDLAYPTENSPGASDAFMASPGYLQLENLADEIKLARHNNRKVVWFIGGHVIKCGLAPYLNAMMLEGDINHLAGNGAVMIHDYELATHGGTSENVPKYLAEGQFGLWTSMLELNEAIEDAHTAGYGMGEGVGISIKRSRYSSYSILSAADTCNVPLTIHPTIGADINHMCATESQQAAIGILAFRDFRVFAQSILGMVRNGGVFINVGSAVAGPELFLKALSMARNVTPASNRKSFTTAVLDIATRPDSWRETTESNQSYYLRAIKTVLTRAVDVEPIGTGMYIQGNHNDTIPALLKLLTDKEKK